MRVNDEGEKQGWVPETYLERRYVVDLQELSGMTEEDLWRRDF